MKNSYSGAVFKSKIIMKIDYNESKVYNWFKNHLAFYCIITDFSSHDHGLNYSIGGTHED